MSAYHKIKNHYILIIVFLSICTVALADPDTSRADFHNRALANVRYGISDGAYLTTLEEFWRPAHTFGITLRYPIWIFKEGGNLAFNLEYLHFPGRENIIYPIDYFDSTSESRINPEDTYIINSSVDIYIYTNSYRFPLRGYLLIGFGYLYRGDFKISPDSETLSSVKTTYDGGLSISVGIGFEFRLIKRYSLMTGIKRVMGTTKPGISKYDQFSLSLGFKL